MVLPPFQEPVWWCLDALTNRDDFLPLLTQEAAEFEAVLGQPVTFARPPHHEPDNDVWDVVVDATLDHASLASDIANRRLIMTIPDASAFLTGVNLLHSLAYSPETIVSDTEALTYAAAFDRIHDEIANIFPSMHLRDLDWDAISETCAYVRDLEGPEFWDHARRWVARLGDAHTQLVHDKATFHPPYLAAMDNEGATLLRVPQDTDAWTAGVRPGDRLLVDQPEFWLGTVGASPQQHPMMTARRYLTMTTHTHDFSAVTHDHRRIVWTETRGLQPSVVADANLIVISSMTPDLPDVLRESLNGADPKKPLILDLRGNSGGNLLAATEARRLFVRSNIPFGSIAFTTGQGTLATPTPLTTTPASDAWPGAVRVLIDAMTYSAAEDFLHPLLGEPHVTVVGTPTGGGSGRPHTRLIKDGVRLATSTAITYTRGGSPIEYLGIQPHGFGES